MEPDYLTFSPRYSTRIRLLTMLLPVIFFTMMCNAAFAMSRFPILFWVLSLFLGLLTSLIPFLTIREIRFLDELVVRRHFLPDLFFSLKEIEQVGPKMILAAQRHVRLGELANLEELQEIYKRWKAARLLKQNKTIAQPKISMYPQRGYGTYASFWGLIAGIIVMLMQPAWLSLDPRWVLGGSFLFVYLVYIYIIPKIL